MIYRIFQRYNRWASGRFHLHFYAPESVCDRLDVDMIPVPCPLWFDRNGRWRYLEFWRFSLDS